MGDHAVEGSVLVAPSEGGLQPVGGDIREAAIGGMSARIATALMQLASSSEDERATE